MHNRLLLSRALRQGIAHPTSTNLFTLINSKSCRLHSKQNYSESGIALLKICIESHEGKLPFKVTVQPTNIGQLKTDCRM